MRNLLWIPVVVIVVIAGLAGWTWWKSEAHLRSFASPPAFAQAIPTDQASLALGEHIARTRGCFSCHGDNLQGEVFHEGPWGERAVAPALSVLAKSESPAMLERAIRHGIGRDGRALYSMPAYNFMTLTDADTAALIAYLKSTPRTVAKLPRGRLGWKIRWALATGKDAAVPGFLDKVPPLSWQGDSSRAVRRGEYLAMTSCNECHGFGLRGDDPFNPPGKGPPDLVIVGAYDRADFIKLMRTGKAAGDRELRMMSPVARGRFVHWSDGEVDDLYTFFQAMAARANAAPAKP